MSTRRAARAAATAGKRVLVADTSNNTNTNNNNNVTKRPLPQQRPPPITRKRSPEQHQPEVEVSREDDDNDALSSELSSVTSSDTASEFELSDGEKETTSQYFQKPGTAAGAVLKSRLPANSRGRRGKLGAKIEEAIKAEPSPELGDLPAHLKPSSTNKRKHGTTKKNSTPSTNPPPNWQAMYAAVREMRSRIPAPVDTMGCERLADAASTPKIRRFQTLVSLMLSSQTKDTVNAVAMKQLREGLPGGLCLESILAVEPNRLDELIHIVCPPPL